MTDVKKQTDNHGINYSFQIVDVVPAIVGNVFARAVAHEWQVSNGVHQNGGGQMSSQNGNSTAVSNSISSSKGRKLYMIYQYRRQPQLVLDLNILFLIIVAKDFSQYEPIFLQMSEDKKTVNAFELADLLEACLPNGKTSWYNTYLTCILFFIHIL